MMMLTPLLLVAALASDPAPARFTFVDAFGPAPGATPRYRLLPLGPTPARPLAGGPMTGPGTYFALVRVGTTRDTALGVALEAGGAAMWLDADGDGRLTAADRHPFAGKTAEAKARVRLGDVTADRTVVFRRGTGTSLYLAVRGHTRGRITLGEPDYAAALTDGDADGCFDTAGEDRVWIDLNGDGAFDPVTEQFPLGAPIPLGGRLYLVQPDPAGTTVRVRIRGTEVGTLRPTVPLRPGATVREFQASLVSEFGELAVLRAAGRPVELPAGRYRVEGLSVRAVDGDGRVWTFRFRGQRQFAVQVDPGKESTADLLAGLALGTGVTAGTAAPGESVMVSPMWEAATGLYLSECQLGGADSGADIALCDTGGAVLDRTASGFH